MRDYPYSRPVEVEYFTSFWLQLRYRSGSFIKQAGYAVLDGGRTNGDGANISAAHLTGCFFGLTVTIAKSARPWMLCFQEKRIFSSGFGGRLTLQHQGCGRNGLQSERSVVAVEVGLRLRLCLRLVRHFSFSTIHVNRRFDACELLLSWVILTDSRRKKAKPAFRAATFCVTSNDGSSEKNNTCGFKYRDQGRCRHWRRHARPPQSSACHNGGARGGR